MLRRYAAAAIATGLVLSGGAALAQIAVPDPGLINQENQRNRLQLEERVAPKAPTTLIVPPSRPPGTVTPPGGPTVVLRQVIFAPSAFLKTTELDASAAKYVGRRVDISEIERLVKAVNDLYAAKGIVTASASLPPQDLASGVLHIALIEGHVGAVNIKDNHALHGSYVRASVPESSGAVVDVPRLANQLSRFNKTGVAQIQASLQPGSQFGLTDIQLAVIEPPVNSLDLFVDNQGVPSVGQYEGGFLYQRYAPLGVDDKFTLYGVFADGDASVSGAYSLPFNRRGGRLGVSASYGNIRVIDGPFRPLRILGNSLTTALNATQPIFIDQKWLLLGDAAFSYSQSNSDQNHAPITRNETYKASVGFTAGYTDPVVSANLSATFSDGRTDIWVTDTRQKFELYNGNYSFLLRMPGATDATISGAFQVSSKSLLPGDQLFQIGGPTTVRGYQSNAIAGATGYYTNVEVHHDLKIIHSGLSGYVFYDHGAVYNPFPGVLNLNSLGFGMTVELQKYGLAELGIGFPVSNVFDRQPSCEAYVRLTAKFR